THESHTTSIAQDCAARRQGLSSQHAIEAIAVWIFYDTSCAFASRTSKVLSVRCARFACGRTFFLCSLVCCLLPVRLFVNRAETGRYRGVVLRMIGRESTVVVSYDRDTWHHFFTAV